MKKLVLILVLALTATTASAEFSKTGSAGAQFLKIGVGSKYQGMAEAGAAMANDVYAMYWNPAGLAAIDGSEISFTNVNWLLDIDLNYVAFARYFEDVGTFGVSAAILSMDDQEITTFEQQSGTGDYYSASSYAISASFARQLTDKFAFGISAKYLGEKIHNETSQGFAFDFGTMLHTGFRSLRLGMSISNLGPEMEFTGSDLAVRYDSRNGEGTNDPVPANLSTTPYDLPMLFRVGMAYDVDLGPKSLVTFSGEIKHPNDNIQQGAVGAQFGYSEQFFLRSGYKFNTEEEGLAFGAGLATNISNGTKLVIDYAWQDFGRFESAQRFSIGFVF
jgi:long-subunit fatty acid transport protein